MNYFGYVEKAFRGMTVFARKQPVHKVPEYSPTLKGMQVKNKNTYIPF